MSGFNSVSQGFLGGSGSGSQPVSTKPLIGVVGGVGSTDPVAGNTAFQNDNLIGLGSTNSDRIQIIVDDIIYSNFGTNINFTFDNITGTITDFFWVTGAGLYINLNQ